MPHPPDAPLELPPSLETAAAARRHVRRALLDWRLDDLLDPVLLLTSELVTNALLHTGTTVTVAVRREDPGVHVEVRDGSPVSPVLLRRSSTATTGRGLQLLDTLADDWGYRPAGVGKVVWFTVLSGESWSAAFDPDLLSRPQP